MYYMKTTYYILYQSRIYTCILNYRNAKMGNVKKFNKIYATCTLKTKHCCKKFSEASGLPWWLRY